MNGIDFGSMFDGPRGGSRRSSFSSASPLLGASSGGIANGNINNGKLSFAVSDANGFPLGDNRPLSSIDFLSMSNLPLTSSPYASFLPGNFGRNSDSLFFPHLSAPGSQQESPYFGAAVVSPFTAAMMMWYVCSVSHRQLQLVHGDGV